MTSESTSLEGVQILRPTVHTDDRGFLMEAFSQKALSDAGIPFTIVQHNQSHSRKDVIRGIHFQWEPALKKIVRVVQGRAYVVAVDLRSASPTRGSWYATELSSENASMLSLPSGVGFGFCALSDAVDMEYYYDAPYNAEGEGSIVWNDPELAIPWPCAAPLLSGRDKNAQTLKEWSARPEASLL